MILNDRQIIHLCRRTPIGMIYPFVLEQVREQSGQKCVSFGPSSFGYDIRLGKDFKRPLSGGEFDPHYPANVSFNSIQWDYYVINPGEMVLGVSLETFNMPEYVMAICLGKSTYARCGLFVNVTPLEPGWCGQLTMELSNIGHVPIKVYANEGIAQLIFYKGERPAVTYADRAGKYQGQSGVQPAKI